MYRSLLVVCALLFAVLPLAANAESGPFNLHVEPALVFPFAPTAGARLGQSVAVKGDLPVHQRLAAQLGVAALAFPSVTFLEPGNLFGGTAGVRYRLADDQTGYALHWGQMEGHEGNLWGNIWVDLNVGVFSGPAARFGIDLGLGAELSLVDGLQIGPFAKYALVGGEHLGILGLSVSIATVDTSVHREDPDRDGIRTSKDRCPTDPEDDDEFEDHDGCPDKDNDGDAIPDTSDKCANEAEDRDGRQDDDGCPDKDNDADGIDDPSDRCPNDPEDQDGFEDLDGCPDKDNDQDAVPDELDRCPLEPETYNGNEDQDGCPEQAAQVFIEKQAIKITDHIYFEFNKHRILPKSYALLIKVAQLMKEFPGIKKLRVDGHTDDVGTEQANQKLSEKRAESVMKFLIEQGIEPHRLDFKGFGKSRPLVESSDEGAREKNRRVEFTIVDPAGGFVP